MKNAIALAVLALLCGCRSGPQRRIVLPYTAEAMACQRQCMSMNIDCRQLADQRAMRGQEYWPGQAHQACDRYGNECLLTCPGATVQTMAER